MFNNNTLYFLCISTTLYDRRTCRPNPHKKEPVTDRLLCMKLIISGKK